MFTRHLREHSAYAGATARDTTQCALTGAAAASLWVRLFLVESELSSSIIPGLGPPRHCIDPHSILPLHASIHSGSTILLQRVRGTAVAADCVLTTPCIDCGSRHFVAELRAQSAPAELISSGAAPRCALSATASMELHTALLSTKWCVLRVLLLQRPRFPGRSSFLHGWEFSCSCASRSKLPPRSCLCRALAAPRPPRTRWLRSFCSFRSRSLRRRLIAFARAA